jgi:hypothetical protein
MRFIIDRVDCNQLKVQLIEKRFLIYYLQHKCVNRFLQHMKGKKNELSFRLKKNIFKGILSFFTLNNSRYTFGF